MKKVSCLLVLFFLLLSSYVHAGTFEWNDNGTVTDTKTGLVWQLRGPTTTMSWAEAMQYCENLELARHNDWRLPSEEELKTLQEVFYNDTNNYMNYFPDTKDYFYWTSTKMDWMSGPCDPPGYAMIDLFAKVNTTLDLCMTNKYLVRAVRGGASP